MSALESRTTPGITRRLKTFPEWGSVWNDCRENFSSSSRKATDMNTLTLFGEHKAHHSRGGLWKWVSPGCRDIFGKINAAQEKSHALTFSRSKLRHQTQEYTLNPAVFENLQITDRKSKNVCHQFWTTHSLEHNLEPHSSCKIPHNGTKQSDNCSAEKLLQATHIATCAEANAISSYCFVKAKGNADANLCQAGVFVDQLRSRKADSSLSWPSLGSSPSALARFARPGAAFPDTVAAHDICSWEGREKAKFHIFERSCVFFLCVSMFVSVHTIAAREIWLPSPDKLLTARFDKVSCMPGMDAVRFVCARGSMFPTQDSSRFSSLEKHPNVEQMEIRGNNANVSSLFLQPLLLRSARIHDSPPPHSCWGGPPNDKDT